MKRIGWLAAAWVLSVAFWVLTQEAPGLLSASPSAPTESEPSGQGVSYQQIVEAEQNPGHWLTYSGTYRSQRYSRLDQVHRGNVSQLRLKWVYQMKTLVKTETSPLVVDETLYATKSPSDAFALDARTGRPYWSYERQLPDRISVCCEFVNRGLAILGDRVYLGTLDAHLVALDRKTGAVIWDREVADYRRGYSITVAPLAVKDKIVVGIAGGEYGIRGFLDAYNARTGERAWRFYTIPGPGEPGHETWSGDSWKTGGGSTWLTGSFDPELNLIYWGIGNPSPDFDGRKREGDNLYTDSAIALDADTGKLKWHFQFTPHDIHDWDAVQIPVLADAPFQGRQRKLIFWANRNAFYYVLDRETGEFLLAKQFAHQNWAKEIDSSGRPVRIPNMEPSEDGVLVYPGVQGATNWFSPSYSPRTGLFYVNVWELPNLFYMEEQEYDPGNFFFGSLIQGASQEPGYGALRAMIPQTGELMWEYRLHSVPWAGILSTAGDVIFSGTNDGQFFALDAQTGRELWVASLGGIISAGPVTYLSEGKQQVAISAGNGLFVFELRQ